jgi:hypothetical protein
MDDATESQSQQLSTDTLLWVLTVVHHPITVAVGRRVVLDPRRELVLGRSLATFGDDLGSDRRLSRDHAKVGLENDRPRIVDCDSHNGTFVNGARIHAPATLSAGDVIAVGSMMLLVEQQPAFRQRPELPGFVYASPAIAACVQTVLSSRSPRLVLRGETGTGKSLLAETTHNVLMGERPLVVVHAGSPAMDVGAVRGAGTLVVDHVDDAHPEFQVASLPILDGLRDTRVIAITQKPLDILVKSGAVRQDFVGRLLGVEVLLPPFRERPSDIAVLAAVAQANMGEERLHPDFLRALLAAPLPGNAREVLALVMDGIANKRTSLTEVKPSGSPRGWVIARDGAKFEIESRTVSLSTRRVLQTLLATLVASHELDPDRSLTVEELLAATWPGERVQARAGASRVYVAVSSLRQLGLEGCIERTATGYRLAPAAAIKLA